MIIITNSDTINSQILLFKIEKFINVENSKQINPYHQVLKLNIIMIKTTTQ